MGEFVAKKYDNTSHMVWWDGHGMICRTDSLGNAARIADALNAQAAPPAALAVDDAMVERALKVLAFEDDGAVFPDAYSDEEAEAEREKMRKALAAALASPAALAVPANVTPLRQPRLDLARLADAISAAVYDNAKGLSVTEAIGALELAKLELLKEQEQ